ncbi:MAG TPA: hypothetical protein PKD55_00090 [Bellilinea sp.]|nr:hypothetical protein [Bellilinea sp.]
MSKKIYSVVMGQAGCLPNFQAVLPTIKDAREEALFLKQEWLDDEGDEIEVFGNVRRDNGYTVVTSHGDWYIEIWPIDLPDGKDRYEFCETFS